MTDLILYTSPDGETRLDLRVDGHTVWLTQLEIAELFQTSKTTRSASNRSATASEASFSSNTWDLGS